MGSEIDPFAPASLGPLTLRNRVIKAATFEGVMPDALVTDELIEYHRRVAAGGVGMTTAPIWPLPPRAGSTPGASGFDPRRWTVSGG